MQITNIQPSGSSNILLWALSNNVKINEDEPLMRLINDELSYILTIEDVNFFELFRLTQVYRDTLRITQTHDIVIPTQNDLTEIYPGSRELPDQSDSVEYGELAYHAITTFINLSMQMNVDIDIIHTDATKLFIPMISRRFDIKIPIQFIDLISAISAVNEEDIDRIFNAEYPSTLDSPSKDNMFNILQLQLINLTQIVRYSQRYDKYLNAVKYFPLKAYDKVTREDLKIVDGTLYKFGLLGFSRYNNVSKEDIKYSMFKPDLNTSAITAIAKMKIPTAPLKFEFVIQLPIHYMQMLLNSYTRDELEIFYESSMANIIDGSISYENFKTSEYTEVDEGYQEYINQVDAYRVRITEANQLMLTAIPLLLESDDIVDTTSVFSMLPSIYKTTCVIRVTADNANKFALHIDPVISDMFLNINRIIDKIVLSIAKSSV